MRDSGDRQKGINHGPNISYFCGLKTTIMGHFCSNDQLFYTRFMPLANSSNMFLFKSRL